MKLYATLALMLICLNSYAGPFLVTDPLPVGVTQCGMYLDSGSVVRFPVVMTSPTIGICKIDLASVAIGSHTVQLTAISNDPLWGESAKSSPLAFARPAASAAPSGLGLTP